MEEYGKYFNQALEAKGLGEFKKAQKLYEKAIALKPDLSEAYFNLAYLKFNDSKPFEAIECYKKVLELNPDDAEAEYFLALAYMQTKNYEQGLKLFEKRLCRKSAIATQEKTYPNLMKKAKLWQGEDISDKTIYTYYEAGFGDMLMFSRYLPLLKQCAKKVILKPQVQIASILRENFPQIEVKDIFPPEAELDFDVHLPFLSLPYALGLSGEELFVGRGGYFKANCQKVSEFKKKFFDNDKLKIGIKWQGNTFYETSRVIGVEAFAPIFELDNVQVYSCQTFEGSTELEKLQKMYEVVDLAPEFKDFSDTAAAVENLDVVICNDTSLAHVAGALGKPCYVVLPHVYNWRWHTDLNVCDWYASLKLFRREEFQEDWSGVFKKIKRELENL